MATRQHAGVYTGKYPVGQRVHSRDTYPTGRYYGTIRNILGGDTFNNAYGVQWDGETHDDNTPVITYMSETDIEAVQCER